LNRRAAGYAQDVPPPGVKKGSRRERQYEHIKDSAEDQGKSEKRAAEIAARTVNKERARAGETKTASKTSLKGKSPSERGGAKSGTNKPKGRTREQLYNEAKQRGVDGRSKMSKAELEKAVDAKK